MLTLRPARARGHTDLGWLDSRHTFSFGDYFDPAHMGFGALRVINDDRVTPGRGFGEHGHRDMEILSVVVDGALAHRDSLGNGSVLRTGDVQRMRAGTGIRHSEFNASKDAPVHFLQIWIVPDHDGLAPGYEERHFPEAERRGLLRLIASRDGRSGSLTLDRDVDVYLTALRARDKVEHELDAGRSGWLQVIDGQIDANGVRLAAGDGLMVRAERALELSSPGAGSAVLFDLVETSDPEARR